MNFSRRNTVFSVLFLALCLNSACEAKGSLVFLNEDNWDDMLTGEWMVEFFAPWCPACKSLNPIWKEFASWSDDLGISVGQVDVNSSPELSGRFLVSALPTIYHVKDGVFRQYHGSRGKDEFMTFIEEKKWTDLEEMSPWKSPSSIQMSIVAKFFKLSMHLRNLHTSITEDYGLPIWSSYLMFALATILVGALLGLILVCIIDLMFPPKPMSKDYAMRAAGKAQDEGDLEDDMAEKKDSSSDKEAQSEQSGVEADGSPSGSPAVRKRKARKAD